MLKLPLGYIIALIITSIFTWILIGRTWYKKNLNKDEVLFCLGLYIVTITWFIVLFININ